MKYALVTGASRGIGNAVAQRLARDYTVIINYRSSEAEVLSLLTSSLFCAIRLRILKINELRQIYRWLWVAQVKK